MSHVVWQVYNCESLWGVLFLLIAAWAWYETLSPAAWRKARSRGLTMFGYDMGVPRRQDEPDDEYFQRVRSFVKNGYKTDG